MMLQRTKTLCKPRGTVIIAPPRKAENSSSDLGCFAAGSQTQNRCRLRWMQRALLFQNDPTGPQKDLIKPCRRDPVSTTDANFHETLYQRLDKLGRKTKASLLEPLWRIGEGGGVSSVLRGWGYRPSHGLFQGLGFRVSSFWFGVQGFQFRV